MEIFRICTIIIASMIYFYADTCKADCGEFCDCGRVDKRVICDEVGLKEIPDDLPKDTKALVIAGNPSKEFQLRGLKKYYFKGLDDIEEISITFGGLKSIDPDAFQDLKQLKRINLQFNQISTIYQATFKGLDDLEVINLNGNNNCDIQTGAVSDLQSLRNLHLADLKMRHLPIDSFTGLDSLVHLDIAGNNIRKLDKDVFEPLKNLVSLDVSGNNLRGLDSGMSTTLSKLTSLTLGDNPWQCNCDIKWFKNLPTKFIYDSASYSPSRVVVCNGPTDVQYKNLVDVPDILLKCIDPTIKDCKDIDLLEGGSGDISCTIEGDPFPDITWTLPDKSTVLKSTDPPIDDAKYDVLDNGTLVIKSAEKSQNGIWTIDVYGDGSTDSATVSVNVTSKATDTINNDPEKATSNLAMIGGIIGGVVGLICMIIIVAVCCKNKKNKIQSDLGEG